MLHMFIPDGSSFRRLKLMQEALTGLAQPGGLALWWHLLGLDRPLLQSYCAAERTGLHWPSVLLGLLCGLVLGPVLDALVTLRVLLFQYLVRQSQGPRPAPQPAARRAAYRLC